MKFKLFVSVLILLFISIIWTQPSQAAVDAVVSECTESGLNAALATVMPGGGTITFSCSGTINITSQKVFDGMGNNYTIDGGGEVTINGQAQTRIFLVPPGRNVSLTVRGLTLTNGRANTAADNAISLPNGGQGGAIYFHYGNRTLSIYDSVFTGNVAQGTSYYDGGGVLHIRNSQGLYVENSVFSGNSASNGGVMNILITPGTLVNNQYLNNAATGAGGSAGNGGAIYIDNGMLTFRNSLFQGNTATGLGGGYFNAGGSRNIGGETLIDLYFLNNVGDGGGGVYSVDDRLTVSGSTFASNGSPSHGGGLSHESKNNTYFTALITNSTFSGNESGNAYLGNDDPDAANGNGGAIVNSGAAAMTISYTTIANNATGVQGSAVRTGNGPVYISNSIITQNTSTFQWINEQCYGNIQDYGGNIQYPATDPVWGRDARCFTNRAADANPQLQPLADNGDFTPTPTHAILAGSPAIDHAPCPITTGPDQRGMLRPQGQRCDSGAYEARTGTPPTDVAIIGDLNVVPVMPSYQWADNANGEWYNVLVANDTGILLDYWAEASDLCSADVCTLANTGLYDAWGLLGGDHYLWVQSWSQAAGFVSTDPQTFTVDLETPDVIMPISPEDGEGIASGQITLSWVNDANAQWYNLYIIGPGYNQDEWHEGAVVCTSETCALPSRNLPAGPYDWYIRAWGAGGMGPWSDEYTFYSGPPAPSEIVRIGPSGNISDAAVTLQWEEDENAEWYQVYIQGAFGVRNQWFAATDEIGDDYGYVGICTEGICSASATVSNWWLSNGSFSWWVAGWGQGGMGEWDVDAMSFTLDAGSIAVVTTQAPTESETISSGDVVFSWDEDVDAAWYRIYLMRNGATYADEWFEAGAVCAEGICTTSINLSAGSYDWYMQAWGPAGIGDFNSGVSFTAS